MKVYKPVCDGRNSLFGETVQVEKDTGLEFFDLSEGYAARAVKENPGYYVKPAKGAKQ